ncbi:MAG: preprotein translocase subunit SecE [Desulfobacterales bacterium]
MARLQKKKTSSAKKKKKQSVSGETSPGLTNDVAAKKTTRFTGSAGEIKKRSSVLQAKTLTRKKTEPGKIKNYINRAVQFLREVKVELKKVVWPTRKQTLGSTVVVIILTMIIASFLGVVDIGLSSLIRVVLH